MSIIRTNKPTNNRIIISRLEIVEVRFCIEIVTSVSERVDGRDIHSACVGCDCAYAPCVVWISCLCYSVLVGDLDYITLEVLAEVIRCAVIDYSKNAILDQRPYKNCTVFSEVFWQESANLSDKLIANICICYYNLHYIALYPFCQWSFDFFNIFVSII